MRADSTQVLSGDDGRPSVRIESKKKFFGGLIVIDVDHMPGGICGVWPAFWTYGPHWPKNGEIDIIEGVNQFQANRMTLHTAPGCYIKNQSASLQHYSGSLVYTNCTSGNGCSIGSLDTATYGDGFNANGGGIYATEWTDAYIAIYFFPREVCAQSDPFTGPLGIHPDPSTWGSPVSRFDVTCNIEQNFRDHSIVFDITFCGDWADGQDQWNSTIPVKTTWPPYATSSGSWVHSAKKHGFGPYLAHNSTCAAKTGMICKDWVKSSPGAFQDAYWSVNALRVYQEADGMASYQGGPSLSLDVEVDVELSSGSDGQNQPQPQQQGQTPPNLVGSEAKPPERHSHHKHHKRKHGH
ncbi:putative endo-1,3(4)-beta-glucanase [Cercospora zeina]